MDVVPSCCAVYHHGLRLHIHFNLLKTSRYILSAVNISFKNMNYSAIAFYHLFSLATQKRRALKSISNSFVLKQAEQKYVLKTGKRKKADHLKYV
jgi:hypothetical protein